MKKLFVLCLASLFLSFSVAIADGLDFSCMSDDQLRETIDQINVELATRQRQNAPSDDVLAETDFDGVHLEVLNIALSHETLGNDIGKPAVIVNCRFTNTGTEDKCFAQLVNVIAFQNKIECKGGSLIDGTNGQLNTTKVQPGGTFEVPVGKILSDTENPVEFQFGTLFKPNQLTLTYDPKQ